jgi:glutamyl-tRNA reductase
MTTPSRPSPTRILLLGAGELGLALLSHLATLPSVDITIGVRSPEKHSHLASSTVALLHLDLTAASNTLIPLLNNYSIIISATGFTSTPGSVTKLAAEVLAAGQLRQKRGEGELWFFPWQWALITMSQGMGRG